MDDSQPPLRNANDSQRDDYVDNDIPPIKGRLVRLFVLVSLGFVTFLLCAGGPIALFFSIPAYRIARAERQAILSGKAPYSDFKWIETGLGASRIITGASIGMSLIWAICFIALWIKR